jgi:hypothetical protein
VLNVGKSGLLDALLLMDYRFLLVPIVALLTYFRPSVSLSVAESRAAFSSLRRAFSISSAFSKQFDAIRFANALVCGFLAWLAAGLLPLLVRSMHWPLVLDGPIMHYIAWRILNGAVPYRDIFDLNMPGAYVLHIAILKVFGASDSGWRLFDFLWLVLTNCLLWRICFPVGRWWAIAAVLFYSAFHLSSGPTAMGQRDYLEFTFLLCALLLAVMAFDNELDRRYLSLAGIAFGCGMSIKPMAGILWIAVAVMAALRPRDTRKTRWSALAAVLAGGLLAPGLLGVWLAVTGGLKPFLVIIAGVLPLYAKMHDRPFATFLAAYWPMVVACILTIPASLLKGRPGTRQTTLILGVIYGVLHYGIQGKGWLYHLYPLVGFSSALLACTVGTALRTGRRDVVLAVSALTIYFTIAFGSWDGRLRHAMALTAAASSTVSSLQEDLRPRLGPNVTVQPFDTAGGCIHVCLRLKIALPTQYLGDYLFFVHTDTLYVREIQAQLMTELRRRPPTYLVVHRWGFPSGQYERIDRFPELMRFIHDHYRLEISRPDYVIYERHASANGTLTQAIDSPKVSR